jgi:GT2 family glycosyltransferase
VVLVCMNNRKYLRDCLASLYGAGLRAAFDVVVVDNGSTDGTQDMLREGYPLVQLIENHRNVGLSRASNMGIQATDGRYVLLLNDDTLVNRESLDSLVQFLDKHPECAVAGGRLLNADGSLQAGFANFSTLREEFLIATALGQVFWKGYPYCNDASEPREVDWLGSACLLLRRSALESTGLLDEEFFIYGDEADLQYRLKSAGWQVYFLPYVHTIHFGGRSLDRWRRRKMVYRGKLLFYRKNYGKLRTALLRALFAVLTLGKLAVWALAFTNPKWRLRASRELRSNVEVLALCAKLV